MQTQASQREGAVCVEMKQAAPATEGEHIVQPLASLGVSAPVLGNPREANFSQDVDLDIDALPLCQRFVQQRIRLLELLASQGQQTEADLQAAAIGRQILALKPLPNKAKDPLGLAQLLPAYQVVGLVEQRPDDDPGSLRNLLAALHTMRKFLHAFVVLAVEIISLTQMERSEDLPGNLPGRNSCFLGRA